jgi:hypothetical protein
VIYLIDSNLSETEAKKAIQTSFTQTYFGKQPEEVAAGYVIGGEKGLSEEAKNIFDCTSIAFLGKIKFSLVKHGITSRIYPHQAQKVTIYRAFTMRKI